MTMPLTVPSPTNTTHSSPLSPVPSITLSLPSSLLSSDSSDSLSSSNSSPSFNCPNRPMSTHAISTCFATVKQDAPSKCCFFNMNPTVMCAYKMVCLKYFDTKDVSTDKPV